MLYFSFTLEFNIHIQFIFLYKKKKKKNRKYSQKKISKIQFHLIIVFSTYKLCQLTYTWTHFQEKWQERRLEEIKINWKSYILCNLTAKYFKPNSEN